MKVTVCGSFRRHFGAIRLAIEELQDHETEVLSPNPGGLSVVASIEDAFLLLRGDKASPRQMTPGQLIRVTEGLHLRAIAGSDFVWVVAPDGYIGASTALEIGFAVGKRIPVFCINEVDPSTDGMMDPADHVTVVAGVADAIQRLQRSETEPDGQSGQGIII